MYGFECERKIKKGCCPDRRCIFPEVCSGLRVDHGKQADLLRAILALDGVRKVFVASGIRHDLVLADRQGGGRYMEQLVRQHVSGQLKVAPEHTEDNVLRMMGKPGAELLLRFREIFNRLTRRAGKKQYLTYYMIAAHPGCRQSDMERLREFSLRELGHLPEQTQIFTPTPSTYSTAMYWTGLDPATGEECFVERSTRGREEQRAALDAK